MFPDSDGDDDTLVLDHYEFDDVKKRRAAARKRALEVLRKTREEGVVSGSTIFLAASFSLMIVETFSSSFTLYRLDHGVSDLIARRVTFSYYGIYAILSTILVVNSVLSLIEAKRKFKRGEITAHQRSIAITEESLSIGSGMMWICLCLSSISMMVTTEFDSIRSAALVLSVAAPLAGALGGFTRVYDTVVEYKSLKKGKGSCESLNVQQQSRRTWHMLLAGLYMCIALFELAHCMCHMYEAYLLQGNVHLIFNIQDRVLLAVQLFLSCLFIILEVTKYYLERKDTAKQMAEQERLLGDITYSDQVRSCRLGAGEQEPNQGGAPPETEEKVPGKMQDVQVLQQSLASHSHIGTCRAVAP
ncbi:MAG: hypothetical protein ACTJLL_04975 [Anaplasma sp.]